MSHWTEDNSHLDELYEDKELLQWGQDEIYRCYSRLVGGFPEELKDKSRVGPLVIYEPDTDLAGRCWVYPLDGSKIHGILLGYKNRVKLIDTDGRVFFDGLWGETTWELIQRQKKCLIWVAPISRRPTQVFRVSTNPSGAPSGKLPS